MSNDSSTLKKGLLFAVAWLAWFFSGFLYAQASGNVREFILTLPPQGKVAAGLWAVVSIGLLFFASMYVLRGLSQGGGRNKTPQA